MSKHYTPLHVHTEFSLLDGAIKLKDYLKFAQDQGWKAAAITDHGNVFGAVKFFQMAPKFGIKPILGCEMYFTPDVNAPKTVEKKYFHLTTIVQNEIGYKNLCRLMSFAYQKGFYFKPRIDMASLKEHNEGLIVSSGCLGGYIPSLLREGEGKKAKEVIDWFVDVFGKDRFFLEVMPVYEQDQKDLNKLIFESSKKYDLNVIATPDSHYLLKEHHNAHEVMLAVGTKNLITDKNRFTFGDFRGHLKTTDEMLSAFPDNPEVVWNTGLIADRCNFNFTFGKLFFPQFPIPKKDTEETYFAKLCWQGLERIFNENLAPVEKREKYNERLQEEIDLICKMGYVGYFLVVGDFIAWAKKTGIPVGPGRGSAAGSLVAWALQITNIDPLKYNLLFERFLNPERVSMPDVDIDFCILGREKVIDYVREKYGHDSVCQIITFGTMMAKGVLKDVARVLGFTFSDSQAITDLIPDQLKISLQESLDQEPRLKNLVDTDSKIKNLFDICFVLEGLTRHASKHAAGVVISPEPLRDVIPLYIPSKSTDLVTQYAMTELESIGFLKMDFLGLKNLTVIDLTLKAIKKRYGKDIDPDKIPRDDQATFQTLCEGKTAGVFQFEGSGVTDVLVKLQPEKFEDLIAVNALYRPGPLGSGMVDDFIDGRHGVKTPTYMFKELEPILSETYGVIVYQEQVMKVASAIAGFSLGSADILRRAMGKKKVDVMAEQRAKFMAGAKAGGFDAIKAGKLFDLMAYFAGYGFNKSHSAAYALIAYQTAYLKTHYPKEFTAATLSFETNDPDKLREYLGKARDIGVKVVKPDINESDAEFTAVDDGVRFGLKGIKNVGGASLADILQVREQGGCFEDLMDFCKRINLRTSNKRVLESLIMSGALDSLPGNRAQKLSKLDECIAKAQWAKEQASCGQVGIFSLTTSESEGNESEQVLFENLEEMSLSEKLEKEKEVLGFYVSSHPLDTYKNLLSWVAISRDKAELKANGSKDLFFSLILISDIKVIKTKKGDRMAFAQFETLDSSGELVVFPKLYAKVEFDLEIGKIYAVTGNSEKSGGTGQKVLAEKIISEEELFKAFKFDIRLVFGNQPAANPVDFIQDLKPNLSKSGSHSLSIGLVENDKKISIRSSQKLSLSLEMLEDFSSRGCEIKLGLKF